MRIAQITSTTISVPPRTHGGTELVVFQLVEQLAARKHDVELFASGDSHVSAPVQAVIETATSYDNGFTVYIDKEMEARNTYNLYRQADRFDIVHAHWPTLAPYFSSYTDTPTVLTYAYMEKHVHEFYRQAFPRLQPVCVSHSQARSLGDPDLPVVHNGIDVEGMPFSDCPEDYLILVGRITPEKGTAQAIRAAKRAGERLVLIGHAPWQIPGCRTYYEQEVAPLVDGDQVCHLDPMPHAEALEYVSRAKAFLFPLQWEEPFGLVVVEASAVGTPVITYARGSMPELVRNGVNGWLAESEDDLVRALSRVEEVSRSACRQWAREQFGLEEMVRGYEAVYEAAIGMQ